MNRLPTGILNFKSPLDTFSTHFELPSSLSLEPKVFGCSVFVHIPKHERTKLDPCAIKCVFLGYGKNQKGYRCYDPKTRHIHTTMNCDFVEDEYFYSQSGGQGETQAPDNHPNSDHLNWLPTPTTNNPREHQSGGESQPSQAIIVSPTEEVNNTTEPPNPVVQNGEQSDIAQPSTPTTIPEVNSSDINDIPSENTNVDRNNDEDHEVRNEEGNIRPAYDLPERSTRGIPPRRFSPEWKGRKAKYAVTNIAQGHLSEMARAFEAAL